MQSLFITIASNFAEIIKIISLRRFDLCVISSPILKKKKNSIASIAHYLNISSWFSIDSAFFVRSFESHLFIFLPRQIIIHFQKVNDMCTIILFCSVMC